jgi:purine-binding chemotaxis protein CheW
MDTLVASPDAVSPAVESLARLVPAPAPAAAPGEYLSLKLGAEEYGIDILRVQEIRSYEPPTRIANAPAYIKGVVNLRGVIVPVVDLRLKFSLDTAEYNEFTVVIILNVARRIVGVVVDSVSDVIQFGPGEIRPVPEFASSVDAGFVTGIGTAKDGERERMLILIDIENLISSCSVSLADPLVH